MQKKGNTIFSVIAILGSLFFLSNFGLLQAQQATVSAGGNAKGNGGSASFTLGQVFFQTYEADGASISEGVQQPYEIFLINSVENAPEISLSLIVFPNPVADRLNLVMDADLSLGEYYFRVFDSQGRLVKSDQLISKHTELDMSGLDPAVYIINIFDSSQQLKSFKIIKN